MNGHFAPLDDARVDPHSGHRGLAVQQQRACLREIVLGRVFRPVVVR